MTVPEAEQHTPTHLLSALLHDTPVQTPDQDRLNRGPFAKQLADSILSLSVDEGFVFSLNGPWGSGKTSLINLVLHNIEGDRTPKIAKTVVVRFNPWWFSGQEDLIQQFFRQFRTALGAKDAPKVLHNVGDALDRFSKMLAPLHLVQHPGVAAATTVVTSGAKAAGEALKAAGRATEQDVHELRQTIDNALKKQKHRILVVIDDIDRLTSDEIRQIFRLVKAVADFPKTIYLLAFDTNVVAKALDEPACGSGQEFIHKIVQLPLDVPFPDRASLHRIFLTGLDSALDGTPPRLWLKDAWPVVFHEAVSPYLRTPRDINRLLNRLHATYPCCRGDVNATDFLVIQALSVFEPSLVSFMASNPSFFTGTSSSDSPLSITEKLTSERAAALLNDCGLRNITAAQHALMLLFPRWADALSSVSSFLHSSTASADRAFRRIAHEDVFPVYFRLQVPDGTVGAVEVSDILSLWQDEPALQKQVRALASQKGPNGVTRVPSFLERIYDAPESTVPEEAIEPLIRTLLTVGDDLLIESDSTGWFGIENSSHIWMALMVLLRRIPQQEKRESVLADAIRNATALSIVNGLVYNLGVELGKYSTGEHRTSYAEPPLFTMEQVDRLEHVAVERIQRAVGDETLEQSPRLGHILVNWKRWGVPTDAQSFASKLISNDAGFVAFVSAMATRVKSSSDIGVKVCYEMHLDSLHSFVSTPDAELLNRATSLVASGSPLLEGERLQAMQALIDTLSGKQPWMSTP